MCTSMYNVSMYTSIYYMYTLMYYMYASMYSMYTLTF